MGKRRVDGQPFQASGEAAETEDSTAAAVEEEETDGEGAVARLHPLRSSSRAAASGAVTLFPGSRDGSRQAVDALSDTHGRRSHESRLRLLGDRFGTKRIHDFRDHAS